MFAYSSLVKMYELYVLIFRSSIKQHFEVHFFFHFKENKSYQIFLSLEKLSYGFGCSN